MSGTVPMFREMFPTPLSLGLFVLYISLFVNQVFALYLIPASLYCLYNNLSFINLSTFDPTTYFMVLQLRVVVTGVVFQVMCSCFAGVYNEYLLKTQGEVNVFVQNIFHNINSMICIGLVFSYQRGVDGIRWTTLEPFLEPKVFLVVCNNAAVGIVTSFFLKYLNSIVKNFASALELVITAILSYFLFSIPIYLNTVLSILLISIATWTYSRNPIANANTKKSLLPSHK
ncbi:unnamed protein product [Nesidiocoris tenuis]|uniref:Sugar phosphate transporter domain-containing protein n=1 Tax=Nesidiocoris tenuis TaxID=355587 RepID=A0A6H5GRZ7_9HEMI|nr:unnamed protein product [Nesidiocoris tenuis]